MADGTETTRMRGVIPDIGAVGFVSEPWTRTWTSDDTLLYALAVGAGPESLALTTENTADVPQRAVPTFATLIAGVGDGVREAVGPAWDPVRMVYGGQSLIWHRELPANGTAQMRSQVLSIRDRGTGAVIEVATSAVDCESGADLLTARRTVFLRGAGGFDPQRVDTGPMTSPPPPNNTEPELVIHERLPLNQALLFRLTGDHHRLHSDPAFAQQAGFDRPILHGMCTYGVVARVLLRDLLDNDPGRMLSLAARFRAPVWPGDDLEIRCRPDGAGRATFVVLRRGHDRPVMDEGELTYRTDVA